MIELTPFREEHVPLVQPWFEDADTRRYLGGTDWPARIPELVRTIAGEFDGDTTVTGRTAWLALEGGAPVALADVEEYDDGTAGLAIVVAPAARRRGIGSRTLQAVLARVGAPAVGVGVESGNVASVRLFERAGFVRVGDEPDTDGFLQLVRSRESSRHP